MLCEKGVVFVCRNGVLRSTGAIPRSNPATLYLDQPTHYEMLPGRYKTGFFVQFFVVVFGMRTNPGMIIHFFYITRLGNSRRYIRRYMCMDFFYNFYLILISWGGSMRTFRFMRFEFGKWFTLGRCIFYSTNGYWNASNKLLRHVPINILILSYVTRMCATFKWKKSI